MKFCIKFRKDKSGFVGKIDEDVIGKENMSKIKERKQ